MADNPRQPQAQPQQSDAPKGAEPKPEGPKAADAGRTVQARPGPLNEPAPKDEPKGAESKATPKAGGAKAGGMKSRGERSAAMPGGKELRAARKEHFGDGAGTVRIDAPPANSGPDAGPVKLVFVDGAGRKTGEREYHPEAEAAGADKGKGA